jgi:hypothetical protein
LPTLRLVRRNGFRQAAGGKRYTETPATDEAWSINFVARAQVCLCHWLGAGIILGLLIFSRWPFKGV